MARKFGNSVKFNTSSVGFDAVAIGAVYSPAYVQPAEAGFVTGDEPIMRIEEGSDWEIVRGTFNSSTGFVSRDTVYLSKIGGVVGTAPMNLAGAAVVSFVEAAEDFAPLGGMTRDEAGNITIAVGLAAMPWMSAPRFYANGPAETFRGCLLQSGGVARFDIGINNHPELGADTGSDLYINSFADNGTFLRTDLAISRATGEVTVGMLKIAGSVTSGGLVAGLSMRADGVAGTFRGYGLLSSGVYRFDIALTDQAESGGNVGSDLIVNMFADDGTYLGTSMSISRASGWCKFNNGVLLAATLPAIDNAFTLGNASTRFSELHVVSVFQTCDVRDKDVTGALPGAWAAMAVDTTEPVLFRRVVGHYVLAPSATETERNAVGEIVPKMVPVPVPGTRLHAGIPAQAIKAALDAGGLDFGVWGLEDKDNADSRQWQRPDQLIPVLWAALRETRTELAQARGEITALRAEVTALQGYT